MFYNILLDDYNSNCFYGNLNHCSSLCSRVKQTYSQRKTPLFTLCRLYFSFLLHDSIPITIYRIEKKKVHVLNIFGVKIIFRIRFHYKDSLSSIIERIMQKIIICCNVISIRTSACRTLFSNGKRIAFPFPL